jgi:hypothetical protein
MSETFSTPDDNGNRHNTKDDFVLKQLRYIPDFPVNVKDIYSSRLEAILMERLTMSPRIVNIYGYCATAILAERMVPRTETAQDGGERYVPFWNEVVPGTGLMEEAEDSFEEEYHEEVEAAEEAEEVEAAEEAEEVEAAEETEEVEAAEEAEEVEEEDLLANSNEAVGGEVPLSRRLLLGEIVAATVGEERDMMEEGIDLEFSSFPSRNSFSAEVKLDLALQMAEAVADLHGFADGVIAHLDIHIQHWFRWAPYRNLPYNGHDGKGSNNGNNNIIKLNDFNNGKLLEFDSESQTYCPSDQSADGRVSIAVI